METDTETHAQTLSGAWENSLEERDDGLKEPERSRTPQENLQNQLTWAHKGLTETEPPSRKHSLKRPKSFYTYVTDIQLGLHVGLLTAGAGNVSDSDFFPLTAT